MRRALVIGLMILPLVAAAEVYRWKDKQGNVVFSDQPPPGRKADLIPLPTPNLSTTTTPTPAGKNTEPAKAPGKLEEAKAAVGYTTFSIRSPAPGETIRANTGDVDINFDLEPPLQVELGHRFRFFLDGQPLQEGVSPFMVLRNLDRGTHTVQGQVISADGVPITQTDVVEFYLHRQSRLR